MAKAVDDKKQTSRRQLDNAERDVIALGIAVAAIIMFVGTGGMVMPQILRAWMGTGEPPDMALTNAVLLNIALLIFGWRRYNELRIEVVERRRAEENARKLAEIDALTGCLNRRSGAPAIDRLLQGARESSLSVTVFMIDLDNFKQINDFNGHQMGDSVLAVVADRIRTVLPAGSILARIGGDEFVCAISQPASERCQIEQLAMQIIGDVSAPVEDKNMIVETTVSIGMVRSEDFHCVDMPGSGLPDGEESATCADAMIHRADIAMYHAKKTGRNRYCWFEPQLEDELRYRNELENGIRRGIPAGEFVPYYEQQVDLETGELVGFEMLARWNSPKYGLVSPEVFIPIAEEIELISDLSEALIRQALRDAREWDQRLTLSVNISPLQLRDPWFAQKLLHLLIDSGFPPSRLEVEITESCLHENIGAVRSIVSSLKNQGICISLDDFGTGYSSLSQLRSLPFDRLKIDRSFVQELNRKGGRSDLVEAIVSLGKGLALPVTAEGIENSVALDALRAMGNLKGQGYLYGKPEDAATTRERLSGMKLLGSPPAEPEQIAAIAPTEARKTG